MDKEQILGVIENGRHERIRVAVCDLDGILRGKWMAKPKFLKALEKGFGFCDVIFGWDTADDCYDNGQATGWHTGYPDAKVHLDPKTYRPIPWEDGHPFIMGDLSEGESPASAGCPRTLLKGILGQYAQEGFKPLLAQEFEWFNFKKIPEHISTESLRKQTLSEGMFGYSIVRASQHSEYFNDLFDLLHQFGIPLEGLHTETGPGVYEAAIQADFGLAAADKAVLFKTAVKEIAALHGIMPSFMAKWDATLPGCSGHLHQSLWSMDMQRNLFYEDSAPDQMSLLMRQFIAGQLYCLPEILPMYAPTVNSYKRLVEGAWAPVTLTWGIDNRTNAIRALSDGPDGQRAEMRVPGSDTNPFLVIAAALASGLYGIRNGLELQPPTIGNGYEEKRYGVLPSNLKEATDRMANSPVANDLFGNNFVQHFAASRNWEWRKFQTAVTDWELKRYFEGI